MDNFFYEIKRYKTNQKNSKRYNVFDVLGVAERETIICRMIADLLDVKGYHQMGSTFLKLFLDIVMPNEKFENVEKIEVITEYPIPGDTIRRIDIVLRDHARFVPIEVKINAMDQESQCLDYYEYVHQIDDTSPIYYLTKFGNLPSEYSLTKISTNGRIMKSLSEDYVEVISFEKHIYKWISEILTCAMDDDLQSIILQFQKVIEEFCALEDKGLRQMMIKELSSTSDNLRAGITISKGINDAKIQVIRMLFEQFQKETEVWETEYHVKRLPGSWFSYEEQIEEYYKKTESSYPGINYKISDLKTLTDGELWLRIELDYNLFAGICTVKNGEEYNKKLMKKTYDEINEIIGCGISNDESWWRNWNYLPYGGVICRQERIPNFKIMNDIAINIADDDFREQLVKIAVENIEEAFLRKIQCQYVSE